MKHYYRVEDLRTEVYEIESRFDSYFLAQQAAEDFHSNHDGWESSWPLVFVLCLEDGTERARYEVHRETVPEFHAYPVSQSENSE